MSEKPNWKRLLEPNQTISELRTLAQKYRGNLSRLAESRSGKEKWTGELWPEVVKKDREYNLLRLQEVQEKIAAEKKKNDQAAAAHKLNVLRHEAEMKRMQEIIEAQRAARIMQETSIFSLSEIEEAQAIIDELK